MRTKFKTLPLPSVAAIALGDHRLDVSIEEIGPLEAEIMLGTNVRNRTRNSSHTSKLAASISRGEWCLNGETVVFDTNEALVDGQHRLRAVIGSGKAIWTLVVRGVEPIKAQDTTGTGLHRTLGGQLSVHGEESAPTLAAALAVVHRLTIERGWTGSYPTNVQGLVLLEKHPGIRGACLIGGRANRSVIRYSSGTATALYYLFSTVDKADAELFWQRVSDGDGLREGDPIFALRNVLLKDANRPHTQERMGQRNRIALTIKAWNLWRRGEELKLLRWRSGGSKAEPFPQFDEAVEAGA